MKHNAFITDARKGIGEVIAAVLAGEGLRVAVAARTQTDIAICPGYVDTPLTDKAIVNIANRTKMSVAEARATLEKISPQNRLVTPEEAAHVFGSTGKLEWKRLVY